MTVLGKADPAAAGTSPPSPPSRRAGILGIGHELPAGVLTNEDIQALVETSDTWIMERTGIRTRHQVGSGETAATMGAVAARKAIEAAGNPRIGAIICATCSPDTLLPSTACFIQRELGLTGQPAFDINAACSGFVYATAVGNSLIASGTCETALVIATEAMTTLIDYTDRSTCVLFGDGAAAVVLGATAEGGIAATQWFADGSQAELIYYGPANDDETSADHLRMMGKGTFRLAVDRLCTMATDLTARAGWSLDEVDHFVPHQANLRIIESAANRLGVSMDKVIVNVDSVGNTSAASIPLALAGAAASGRLRAGDKVVCIAFGAGATWGGIALEWNKQPTV